MNFSCKADDIRVNCCSEDRINCPLYFSSIAVHPNRQVSSRRQPPLPTHTSTSSILPFGILFATGVEGRVPFQVKIGSDTVISLREETGVATLLEMLSNPILEFTLLFNATTNRTRTGFGTCLYFCTCDAFVFNISTVPLFLPRLPTAPPTDFKKLTVPAIFFAFP